MHLDLIKIIFIFQIFFVLYLTNTWSKAIYFHELCRLCRPERPETLCLNPLPAVKTLVVYYSNKCLSLHTRKLRFKTCFLYYQKYGNSLEWQYLFCIQQKVSILTTDESTNMTKVTLHWLLIVFCIHLVTLSTWTSYKVFIMRECCHIVTALELEPNSWRELWMNCAFIT